MRDRAYTQFAIVLLLFANLFANATEKEADEGGAQIALDESWVKELRRLGWHESQLTNKIQNNDVTTYELGSPNYEILNPDEQPEIITEDQPEFLETLQRVSAEANKEDNSHNKTQTSIAARVEKEVVEFIITKAANAFKPNRTIISSSAKPFEKAKASETLLN